MSLDNPRFDQTKEVAHVGSASGAAHLFRAGGDRDRPTCALPLTPGVPLPFTILENDHPMIGRYDGTATWRSVSPQYFNVFEIRLLRGRICTAEDGVQAAPVALINLAMLKQWKLEGIDLSE